MKKITSLFSFARFLIVGFYIALFALFLHTSKTHEGEENDPEVLHIFGWAEQFLDTTITNFTKETGIKVKTHQYTSNEELITKMQRIQNADYDILIPSDYAVNILAKEGLLQPLDKSQLTFYDKLLPQLLDHDYDKGNHYSIPYQWEVFGFGTDKHLLEEHGGHLGWDMLFDPQDKSFRLCVGDDPIEAIQMGAFYKYGPSKTATLDKHQIKQITALLKRQKKQVEAYTSMRPDYLLMTKNCQLAVSSSSWMLRAARKDASLTFVVPDQWSFISIESMCISKHSKKHKQIYAFLNYIYQDRVMAEDCDAFFNFPATSSALTFMKQLHPNYVQTFERASSDLTFFYFISPLLSEEKTRKLWVDLKS